MTRSTELESESVSTTRYETQDAERESLLSQNWTASEEEDTNALSNIEEENTNMLLFDHEMIKISISTELNAWISTHEADNLVVFIKYMCQQHDIEIEIHNDIIQMLNDVNKINVELKAINIELKATQTTLNAVQTRLQKEMKKKNVIIHHLEVTSSRLSTLISKNRFLKLIKLSDLSLFEDSKQNVNNWLSWMWNKLKMNKNHFSIKEMKIAYVKSRVSETMIKHIAFRMRNMITNSFLEAEEILLIINKMYDDFNQHHTTQRQFLKLYQNKIFFHEFWMKFQRLSAKLEYNNKTLLDDLQHKISSDLQQVMINKRTMNLNKFVDICMQVNVRLTKLNAQSALKILTTQVACSIASILMMITIVISASNSAWKKLRISNVDSAREKLFKKELCFKCKKSEHRAHDCLESAQMHEITANLKNDLFSSK